MNRSEKNADIYAMLPRFVRKKNAGHENLRFLPLIERSFEHNGVKLKLEIAPACIGIENIGNSNFYPGMREELIEEALRRIAVENNPNFKKDEGTVVFSITELLRQLENLEGETSFSREQVIHSLSILCRVSYELSDDGRRMGFRTINWLRKKEKDGETYFMVQLSSLFLNGNEMFDFYFAGEDFDESGSKND